MLCKGTAEFAPGGGAGAGGGARGLAHIGVLRAYMEAYLQNHPMISKDLTLMVRQLEPTPEGVPIQIYCFSLDKVWVNYEKIQSDIYDHFIAVVPVFDLRHR